MRKITLILAFIACFTGLDAAQLAPKIKELQKSVSEIKQLLEVVSGKLTQIQQKLQIQQKDRNSSSPDSYGLEDLFKEN